MPLTADRAKPAVPFGGIYRLIDFALSNVVNSGYLKVVVLTQYKSHSLDRHVTTTWRMSTLLGNYVTPVPAQQRVGKRWYLGSADAIYQSLNLLTDEKPDIVVVVGADHVYRMDFSADGRPARRVRRGLHGGRDPAADRARRPVRRDRRRPEVAATASARSWRSRRTRSGCPTRPTRCSPRWATTSSTPTRCATPSPATPSSSGPSTTWAATSCRGSSTAASRPSTTTRTTRCPGSNDRDRGYWRDVGTMRSYYAAHMDLVAPLPVFNLYNTKWPIYTSYGPQPPAKLVEGHAGEPLTTFNSILSPGVVVTGGTVNTVGALAGLLRRRGRRGLRLGAAARRDRRRRRGRTQRDHRQERGGPARRADRCLTRGRPGARLRGRGRTHGARQGQEVPQAVNDSRAGQPAAAV